MTHGDDPETGEQIHSTATEGKDAIRRSRQAVRAGAVLALACLAACGGSAEGSDTRSERRASQVGDVEICVDATASLSFSVRFNKNDAGGLGPFPLRGEDEYSCAIAPGGSPGADDNLGFKSALVATVTDAGGNRVFEASAWNLALDYPRVEQRVFPEYVGKRWAFSENETRTWEPSGRPFESVVTRDDDGPNNLKHFLVTLRSR